MTYTCYSTGVFEFQNRKVLIDQSTKRTYPANVRYAISTPIILENWEEFTFPCVQSQRE